MTERVKSALDMAQEDLMAKSIYERVCSAFIEQKCGPMPTHDKKSVGKNLSEMEPKFALVKEFAQLSARMYFEKRPSSD
jgi:hypothetical protein